jgi:hypothetical protein
MIKNGLVQFLATLYSSIDVVFSKKYFSYVNETLMPSPRMQVQSVWPKQPKRSINPLRDNIDLEFKWLDIYWILNNPQLKFRYGFSKTCWVKLNSIVVSYILLSKLCCYNFNNNVEIIWYFVKFQFFKLNFLVSICWFFSYFFHCDLLLFINKFLKMELAEFVKPDRLIWNIID